MDQLETQNNQTQTQETPETALDYNVGIPEIPLAPDPIADIPQGLSQSEIEGKARKWNKEWEDASDQLRKDWETYYKAYRQFERSTKQRISTKSNDIFSLVQTEMPHLVNSIFSKSEIVKPVPRTLNIDANTALKVKDYINRMILVSSQGESRCTDAIQNFLLYGSAIGKSFWNLKPNMEIDRQTNLEDGSPNPNFNQWTETFIGEPDWINVDNFEFAVDPNFTHGDLTKSEWVRERIYFKKEELLMAADEGQILPLSDQMLAARGKGNYRSGKEIRDAVDGLKQNDKDKQQIFVDEFWATIYSKTDEGKTVKDEYWFWMLGGEHLIQFRKNDWKRKPYFIARCYRQPGEVFGLGEAAISNTIQNHLSVVHTQAALLAKRAGMNTTLAKPEAGLSNADQKLKEDGILILDEISEEYIRMMPTDAGKDLQILLAYKGSLKQDLQETTGITDTLKGEEAGDNANTATGANILNANASARLAIKLQNFQTEYIQSIARNYFLLCKQFMLTPYQLRNRNSVITLNPEDFIGDYDWVALGSIALSNKSVRIQQLTNLTTQLSQVATQQSQIKAAGFDLMAFVKDNILPLFEVEDMDKYIVNNESQPLGQTQPGITDVSSQPTAANPTSAQVTVPSESAMLGAANSVHAGGGTF